MAINENIKQKRTEKEMTLEALGKAVGVSKQTIQRYETGQISTIPYDKIILLAKALGTTPQALMGWDSCSSSHSVLDAPLSKDESDLLSDYRKLNDDGKAALRNTAAGLVASGAYAPLSGRD